MKEIKAYIRPTMLDRVIDALEEDPRTPGVTMTLVKGYGHSREEGPPEFAERAKLEIVVADDRVERTVSTIVEHGHTGRYGDGKIFISDVERAIRVRTGEEDEAAVRPSEHAGGEE